MRVTLEHNRANTHTYTHTRTHRARSLLEHETRTHNTGMALFQPWVFQHRYPPRCPAYPTVHIMSRLYMANHANVGIQPLLRDPPMWLRHQARPYRCDLLWHLRHGYLPICFMPRLGGPGPGTTTTNNEGDREDRDDTKTTEVSSDDHVTVSSSFEFTIHITIHTHTGTGTVLYVQTFSSGL